jgi:hypothetical protein
LDCEFRCESTFEDPFLPSHEIELNMLFDPSISLVSVWKFQTLDSNRRSREEKSEAVIGAGGVARPY